MLPDKIYGFILIFDILYFYIYDINISYYSIIISHYES